ncbi:MAG: hypothetical protein ACTHK8_16845 [Ginsengibacter sp.]
MKASGFFVLLLFLAAFALLLSFVSLKFSLVGKWSILNPDGTPSGEYVSFNADNTYAVSLPNAQIGERGNYLLKDSLFLIKNIKDVCGKDYWGKYKLTFYGNDSIHFALIEDSCTKRRMDMIGYNPGLKRYKTK